MANKKISELVSRVPSLTDLMLVGDPSSGYSYKCTVSALATIIETDISDGYVTLATTQTISGAKTFSNVLTLTSVANASVDTDKFLVLNGSNAVNYRTGAQVLSDIGGQGALTLTTTGTSGAATLVGNTLNIPQYQAALTNPVTGTGTTNYLPKFTGASTIGNSQLIDDGTTIFLGSSGSLPNVKMNITTVNQRALELISSGGNALFVSSGGAFVMTVTNGTWSTQFTQAGRLDLGGDLSITTIANATTDTDRFLVSDSGVIKYRTGSELLSDIGGASASGYVPYTGATTNVNLGSYSLTADALLSEKYLMVKQTNSGYSASGYTTLTTNSVTPRFTFNYGDGVRFANFNFAGGDYYYTLPSATGTLALTSDITGAISGTTNYIPKFTSSSAIGNSVLYAGSTGFALNNTLNGSGYAIEFETSASTPRFDLVVNGTYQAQLSSSSTATTLKSYTSNPLVFGISNAEQMRLTSTGLGIGTSSPAYKLDVAGSGRFGGIASPRIYAEGNGATGFPGFNLSNTTQGYEIIIRGNLSNVFQIRNTTTSTDLLTIDASGNLGLGVTPSAWGSGRTALQIGNTNSYFIGSQNTVFGNNAYNDGTNWRYITSYNATLFTQAEGGSFAWYNAPSGTAGNAITFTQAMTLDASGRLGIGTTSPNAKIDIAGTNQNSIWFNQSAGGSTTGYIVGRSYSTNNAQDFFIYDVASSAFRFNINSSGNVGIGTTSPTFAAGGGLHINQSGADTRLHLTNSTTGVLATDGFELVLSGNDVYYDSKESAGTHIFYTAGSERMRITSGGELLWNITATTAGGLSGGGVAFRNNAGKYLQISTGLTTDENLILFYKSDGAGGVTNTGSIATSGNNTNYNTSSDYRLKQDLKNFNGLSLVNQINVYDYQWKIDSTRSYGVMAHELQSVLPYAVTGVKDGEKMQGVDYSKIVPILIKSIQELKAEIETLKNK
jgi:Chaperone of endosialidase